MEPACGKILEQTFLTSEAMDIELAIGPRMIQQFFEEAAGFKEAMFVSSLRLQYAERTGMSKMLKWQAMPVAFPAS